MRNTNQMLIATSTICWISLIFNLAALGSPEWMVGIAKWPTGKMTTLQFSLFKKCQVLPYVEHGNGTTINGTNIEPALCYRYPEKYFFQDTEDPGRWKKETADWGRETATGILLILALFGILASALNITAALYDAQKITFYIRMALVQAAVAVVCSLVAILVYGTTLYKDPHVQFVAKNPYASVTLRWGYWLAVAHCLLSTAGVSLIIFTLRRINYLKVKSHVCNEP